jgi:hypothetical protein
MILNFSIKIGFAAALLFATTAAAQEVQTGASLLKAILASAGQFLPPRKR